MASYPFDRHQFFDDPLDRFFLNRFEFYDPRYDFDAFPQILPNMSSFRRIDEQKRLINRFSYRTNDDKSSEYISGVSPLEKFCVQLNVAEFSPEWVKTKVDGRKVIVEAKHEDRQPDGDFNVRQLRKSYDLPEYAGK